MFSAALAPLANTSGGLNTPNSAVGTAFTGFLKSFNEILNYGLIQTNDVVQDFTLLMAETARDVTNELMETANRIQTRRRAVLQSIFQRALDGLDVANNRTNVGLRRGATFAFRILERIRNVFVRVIGRVIPRLETCTTKLGSLQMANPTAAMQAYTKNATDIINALKVKLDNQYDSFWNHVNTTATSVTMLGVQLTADLMKNITDTDELVENTQAFDDCMADTKTLVEYVPILIGDNLVNCMNTSFLEANSTDLAMEQEMKELEAGATATVTNICNCVANVSSTSSMLLRAQASTCATTAVKPLNSTAIEEEANDIAERHNSALTTTTAGFDKCNNDLSDALPDLMVYVYSQIDQCYQMVNP